jgi:photosystem II stability/assembly factor-like uncharacterized protein
MKRALPLIALLALTIPAGVDAATPDRYERFLDPSLKVLYRAQIGPEGADRTQAEGVLNRLHAPTTSRGKGSGRGLLNLVVKFRGDQSRLMDVEFSIDSCIDAICTGSLPMDRLPDLVKVTGIHFVQLSRPIPAAVSPSVSALMSQIAATAVTGQGQTSATKDAGGTGALIAFIDTGVDVFHQDFRKADDTTRIRLLLDFSDPGDIDDDGILDGTGPFGGTLHSEADIDTALLAGTFSSTDPTGHGTHGLSIAAGDDAVTPGMAPTADLIVVKATREDGSLGFYSADIINALSFVDEQASLLGQPYVVNLSLGSTFCSHDGRSLEEQAIDALVGPGVSGKVAVIAAGNASANRSSQFHHFSDTAYVGLDSSHTLTVPAYTPNPDPGNDRILLDIWYEGRDELAITVTGPASCGAPVITADFGHYEDQPTACGDVFIANMGGANPLNGDMEAIVLIDDWSGNPPEPGDWTITFTGEAIGDDGVYHGWLFEGSVVGQTSPYFLSDADNRFLVGTPGGAVNGITVGSYALHDGSPGSRFLTSWTDVNGIGRIDSSAVDGDISNFSSPGPTRDGRVKPDLAAPGERVIGAVSQDAWPGVSPVSIYQYHPWPDADALIVDETTEHGFGMLQGTSFAAPVVAGLAARILSTDPTLDAIQVRNMMINTATTDTTTGDTPSDEWGYGKADRTVSTSTPLPSDLRITTDFLPGGYIGEQYNLVLTASGGTLPYSWSVVSGTLPNGLVLETGGLLVGAPTTGGPFGFELQVVDSSATGSAHTIEYELFVGLNFPLSIVKSAQPIATVDREYASQLEARGGTPPYTWMLAGGQLPPGLSIGPNGWISGSPTSLGRFSFSVSVTDDVSHLVIKSTTIDVRRSNGDDWGPLGRSPAPAIASLAIDRNDSTNLFVSTQTQDGTYGSDNRGESWRLTPINGQTNVTTWSLASSPTTSTFFARTANGYQDDLFRYDQATSSWSAVISDSNVAFRNVYGIDFDHTERLIVLGYFAPAICGVYCIAESDDLGDSWSRVPGEEPVVSDSPDPLSVNRNDSDFMYISGPLSNTGSSTEGLGIYRTGDGGTTWEDISNLTEPWSAKVSQSNPLNIVSIGRFGEIYRTVDGGRNWTESALPASGSPNWIDRSIVNPSHLLVGTSSDLFRSEDDGLTWVRLDINQEHPNITVAKIDPQDENSYWIGTTSGLYLSSDAGQTWTSRNSGLRHRRLVDLAVNPIDPNNVMLIAEEGVFLSRTDGDTWTILDDAFQDGAHSEPVISASDEELFLVLRNNRLFRSDNRGLAWFETSPDFKPLDSFVAYASDPFDSQVVIACFNGSVGTYRSIDRGSTWISVNADLPFTEPTEIRFAPDAAARVYLSFSDNGVYVSENRGDTWSPYGLNSQTVDILAPAPSDSRYLYAYSEGQVYFLDPTEPDWLTASTGPTNPILSIEAHPTNYLIAYAGCEHPGSEGETGGVWRTLDGGRTWEAISGDLDPYSVLSVKTHPTNPQVIFAVTRWGGVYRSSDGGASWIDHDNYGTIADLTNVTLQDPTNEFLLFAGTEGYGVQASTDGGTTFEPRVNGLTNYYVNAMSFDPIDPTILYAGTDAGVFKTIDSANTWEPTDLIAGAVSDMVTDADGTARRIWVTVAGEGVAYSGDEGATFTMYETGLASLELTSIDVENLGGTARRIWVTTYGGDGVAYSDDFGQSWVSAAGNGLTDRDVNDLLIDGAARRIWVTTSSGVFYSDSEGLSWNELSLGLPTGIPVTSVSIDPNTSEAFVSLFSDNGGGVFRGANLTGVWQDFSNGLKELRVKKLTNDGGTIATRQGESATRFFASTRGDGVYRADVQGAASATLTITPAALPEAIAGAPYEVNLSVSGGTSPYAWSLASGQLPVGLALKRETGQIEGVPVLKGLYDFEVRVADDGLRTTTRSYTLRVLDESAALIFADGFESGSTATWSNSTP